ncbi:MAG: acyltransferase [Blastochloris sp.]|nr:acyltransferase [Blastochloris sp.]
MLRFIPGPILGVVAFLGVALNTLFWALPVFVFTIVKFVIPIPSLRRRLSHELVQFAEGWIGVNNALMMLATDIKWEVTGLDSLSRQQWYLICSNHQSLVDIPVLQRVFYKRIPFIRFFLKQELIWVPVLGPIWWALDYPFMKRYSRAYLEKHPEKRGADLLTAQRAGLRFRHTPTTMLNFLEGTRYTPAKHAAQNSPYRHLLRPKAGGIANVISTMHDRMTAILNVTIVYPDGALGFWGLLSGRIKRVIVHVEEITLPAALHAGDYVNDPLFRAQFQEWVQQLWQEKDSLISRLTQQPSPAGQAQ